MSMTATYDIELFFQLYAKKNSEPTHVLKLLNIFGCRFWYKLLNSEGANQNLESLSDATAKINKYCMEIKWVNQITRSQIFSDLSHMFGLLVGRRISHYYMVPVGGFQPVITVGSCSAVVVKSNRVASQLSSLISSDDLQTRKNLYLAQQIEN